ncbi:MAG: hypothetical protein KC917_03670 [Candidatus Omnitrophica bacterium]|nr:hypothetical protein [Candidatus Omnitrophota bacterium]
MEITFLDLRRRPRKLLEALEKKESVTLSRRGMPIATITPIESAPKCKVEEHSAFGMWADDQGKTNVAGYLRDLRKGRLRDI